MMPYYDNAAPKKKKKKPFVRLLQKVFGPSNKHHYGNVKQIKRPWWQKLSSHHSSRKQEKRPYFDWTTLSPNEPPLPFLIKPSSSELPPIINKMPTSLRELYTIVESSETNTNNNSSNSDAASTPEYQQMVNENNVVVYTHIPIFDWPLQAQSPEPIFNTQLIGNEQSCKAIFSQLVTDAYMQQTFTIQPKEMYILFNDQQNVEGITFILSDNSREDYLDFKGSIQYIPPELFMSPVYKNAQVDIWTLGISLYRMLVGKYPFCNELQLPDQQLLEKMLKFDYDIPRTLSEDARDLIQRLISPEKTRASFDLIMFHPWIKSYLQEPELLDNHNNRTQKSLSQSLNWKKRLIRLITKLLLLIVKGPYPPPPLHRKKQKQD